MVEKVKQYVRERVNGNEKTLDIGSLDVNGNLRDLFTDYTGLDMREGDNVDVVSNSHKLPFKDNTFDLVTCVETLEHDDKPFKTLEEIHRVLKDGGKVILCASGISFPKHAYPNDYFRYTAEGIGALLSEFKNIETSEDNDEAYGCAIK
jgi:SAM-dependent methyltransferase